jgi:putative endonuclease
MATPANGLSRKQRGDGAERRARAFLEQQGLQHVASNVRSKRGELDLVMRDGEILVFIEVRLRASERFGGAAASVDHRKQTRIATAAAYFLQKQRPQRACRFDVVALDSADTINWIRNAFSAPT